MYYLYLQVEPCCFYTLVPPVLCLLVLGPSYCSTAIDVVKTRIQVDPMLKSHSLISGTRHIIAAEGSRTLLTGFGPTAVGYFAQGGAKFAGYEFWKRQFALMAGDQETLVKHRTAIYLGAASVAEYVQGPLSGSWNT
jgi:hypothetical protein